MTTINLGSMYSAGGKTVVSGGSSGLDTEALIKGLTEARRLPAVRLEDTIALNTERAGALSEMSSLLERFRDAAGFLRNAPGVATQDRNVFSLRSGTVTTNSGLSGTSYLNATVAAGVNPGNYSISVEQLATRQQRVTESFALAGLNEQAVGGGGPFNAGSLFLGADATEITLEEGDSLRDVLAKINAAKQESGVEASAIETTPGNFQIVFKSLDTGTEQNFDFIGLNPTAMNMGFQSQVDAQDALFTIDGVQVTRQSNVVSNVIEGVTFELRQETPASTRLNLDVNADTSLARDAILNFVDAYNELRVFAAKQTQTTDDGAYMDGAVLGRSSALSSVVNSVSMEIANVVSGLTDSFNELRDIGITLTDYAGDSETPFVRNILQVDEAKLSTALASNFDEVRKIFEFDYSVDNSNMVVYSRTNALNTNEITFNIDMTNGVYEATFATPNGSSQTIALDATALAGGGVSLTGPAGSAIAGLNVLYVSGDDAVVNMKLSQGMGDRFYNLLQDVLDQENGVVATEIKSLQERNVRFEKDIANIDEMIERFRLSLVERFSALEAALSAVNNILQLLDAQANARNAK